MGILMLVNLNKNLFQKKQFVPTQIRNQASNPKKPSANKKTRGWLGGGGGPQTSLDKWYGPDRALFLPSGLLERSDLPSYLSGDLAGDYGYDPLGLGTDADKVRSYRQAELIHSRWAMLAAAGIIIPEGLEANGADIVGGTWFETGAKNARWWRS